MVAAGAPSILITDGSTLQGGIITKPATRYGGSTLGTSTMFANGGDGASIAGFPGSGPGQKYVFYDEADDTPIMRKYKLIYIYTVIFRI